MPKLNVLVLQCGGPTPVVNASLWGVIRSCQEETSIARLWGARNGVRGLIHGDWVELTNYRDPEGQGRRLELQSGAALGSGRTLLAADDVDRVLSRMGAQEIGILILIGGNGTMVVAQKLGQAARFHTNGGPPRVIGVPKTIDNDLAGTDVCPGYGSAARFVAISVHDAGLDMNAMRDFDDVAVFEVMGRYSGWLAAAASLARAQNCVAPHLILFPEVPLDEEAFLAAVKRCHQSDGICMVVTAEGICDENSAFLAEKNQIVDRDASGQKLLGIAGGPAPYLSQLIRQRLKLRCRQIRPDMIQRSSSALASEVDRQLAYKVGKDAVRAAIQGQSNVMIGLERSNKDWRTVCVPLEQVLGRERRLPEKFIDQEKFDVTPAFTSYAQPLVGNWSPGAIVL